LADCAVDGRLPERNLVTPQQTAMEAVKWLERLERGEVSSITKRDLNVELTPIEIKQRIRKYGFDHIAITLSNDALDVPVFSLFLMGKNWADYISEAKRCLATNGYLLIAETTKSLSAGARLSRLRDVVTQQSVEIYTDEEKGDFTFIEAREL
jgi:hypothetical protein